MTRYRRLIPANLKVRDVDSMQDHDFPTAYVVIQQKPLDEDPHVPYFIKWLLRRIYHWYGWAATGHDGKSYCKLEFVGIFDNATAARWAAMIPGGSYRELPLNTSLPEETCQFGNYDHPLSTESAEYRHRRMPFVAVKREDLDALGVKIEQTIDCAHGKCVSKVV